MAVGAVVLNWQLQLGAGREDAREFPIWGQGVLNLTAQGDVPFYVGVYTKEQYERARSMNPSRFPFLIGSARTTHFLRNTIATPGPYVAVVRVSGWAGQRTATIQVLGQIAP
jgi:hypothetical protein